VHLPAVEVCPDSGTHQLVADRDCRDLPQRWASVLEMLPKIKVWSGLEQWLKVGKVSTGRILNEK